MKQKAAIKFEKEETVILRQGGKMVSGFCPYCQQHVEMISPDVLSLVTGASEREIFRLIEAGTIYFEETGRIVVCLKCYQRMLSLAGSV